MDRMIAANTVLQSDADVAPPSGVPGFATNGNPATGRLRTVITAWVANMIQEELRNVVLWAGLAPSNADYTQLAQAVSMVGRGRCLPFYANGSFLVPDGAFRIEVRLWGGGGGGGGAGSASSAGAGGGGGAYVEGVYDVVPGTAYAVTVGQGGLGGSSAGSNGGGGGTSSFGALASATGGTGGNGSANGVAPAAGSGGIPSGGNVFNLNGDNGAVGFAASAGVMVFGAGGGTFNTSCTPATPGQGLTGTGPGGGGSGSASIAAAAPNGNRGLVLVRY